MSHSELDNWCKASRLEPTDFSDLKGHFVYQDISAGTSSCLLPLVKQSLRSSSKSLSVLQDSDQMISLRLQSRRLLSVTIFPPPSRLVLFLVLSHSGRLYCLASCLTLWVSGILITLLSAGMVVYLAAPTTASFSVEKVFLWIKQVRFHERIYSIIKHSLSIDLIISMWSYY